MKKKRKYKSPQIIVMDYEMEESCLDGTGSAPDSLWDSKSREQDNLINTIKIDHNDDWSEY